MKKIVKISILKPFIIICTFDNGEIRSLNLEAILNKNHKFEKKVLKEKIFNTVKIGMNGELYWENVAEIKTLEGEIISCEYDICPDFVYINSEQIKSKSFKKFGISHFCI